MFNTTLIFIYYSIYYPIYFKLGVNKLNLLNRCINIIIFLLPSMVKRLLNSLNISLEYFYTQINFIQDKFLWIILFDIIIVTISVYISMIIHKNKTIMYE
ncbi:ABC-2 transporter permease [Clostridium sporogenes]|uniref:ABC-2 transporter permease n=1 Tax=Clostridium sporogenes TaxID=1509 RepID=A0AAE4FJI0_CLOSG|nr:ABC-2 transporter permease [Clostridium sporogenes]